MAELKAIDPSLYEQWEATRDERDRLSASSKGGAVEQIPTPVTDAFRRSMATVAGVSVRVVSPQATWYLQPSQMPLDVILNMDDQTAGPADRARMLFTTADWIVNWLCRIGCREFYFYGVSMADGRHCKTQHLIEDDDYSWAVPSRHKNCFAAWNTLRDAFPGLKLYNCDRHSLFVEKGEWEFKTPAQLEPNYTLLSDAECISRRDAVMAEALRIARPVIEMAKIQAQMRADAQKRASA